MSDDVRPGFRLYEIDDQRCATCRHVKYSASEAAHCMTGAGGDAAEDGQRVNENFVCDNYTTA